MMWHLEDLMRLNYSISSLFILALALAVGGCEQTVDPVGIPYVERIVVRGVITTGDSIHGIQLSRTLPIDVEYTAEKAALVDADVTIRTGGSAYKASHEGGGLYGVPSLVVQAGETYALEVVWHNKRVTASTLAPQAVPIDSIRLVSVSHDGYIDTVIEVVFVPHGGQVYGVTDQRSNRFNNPGEYIETPLWNSENIARKLDTLADGRIRLRTQYPFYQEVTDPNDTLWGVLYSFDYPFYDYYRTFGKYDNGNGPFSTGGETTAWNVEGDGIGSFIGRARSQRVLVQ